MSDVRQEFCRNTTTLRLSVEEVPALIAAIDRSALAIDRARALLSADKVLAQQGVDFIGFGSLARHEMTPSSDLDYLVVGDTSDASEVLVTAIERAVGALRVSLVDGVTLQPPGTTGLFGQFVESDSITSTIGLQADTNHTLTRRILILEESVSLLKPELHQELLRKILCSYLASRKPGAKRVPRVLLNDIIRYWRTIAIDYHAKSSPDAPYSLRYLKLVIPRKLCFLGSVAPLFLMAVDERELDDIDFLVEAFSQPPLIRLSRLLISLMGDSDSDRLAESVRQILLTMDEFVRMSGDAEWRAAVADECRQSRPVETGNFEQMRGLGRSLHDEIGKILTCEAMLPFTREYMLT